MKDSPRKSPESWKTQLQAAGLRLTVPRLQLVPILVAARQPLTHGELSERLASIGIDPATVFRSLKRLVEVGLVRRLEFGDRLWRFEWIRTRHDIAHFHPHFVCQECGRVECLEDEALALRFAHLERATLGQVTEVLLKGVCWPCHDRGNAAARAQTK